MAFRLANIAGRAVLVDGEHFHDLEAISNGRLGSDPMQAIADSGQLHDLSASLGDRSPSGRIADVTLDAPVPRPVNSFGIGLNYRKHVEESGMAIPAVPLVFTKFPTCICGPTAEVVLRSDFVDYEAELVVVIGSGGRNIKATRAWDHVAGLCVGQDISDRPLQMTSTPPQFDLGKSLDTFGPIGPMVISPDIVDFARDLSIACEVNGEARQQDSTGDLIFDVPTLVAYLSEFITLMPGDLIFTGTPGGVGATVNKYLRHGDVITTRIEGLGTIENRCVRGPDHSRAAFIPDQLKAIAPLTGTAS